MDWDYYSPRLSEEYSISVFDDGNEKYMRYVNVWHKYGEWRGKVAIVNSVDTRVRIESISAWKLDLLCIRNVITIHRADAGGG